MSNEYREFYKRSLPHFQPKGACIFVTFRLAGSLPREVIDLIQRTVHSIGDDADAKTRQRAAFLLYEKNLDSGSTGPLWLRDARVADLIAHRIKERNDKEYALDVFCIMANHVHMVLWPKESAQGYFSLAEILKSIKGFTARGANLLLERTGAFWAPESYDHVVRNEQEWHRTMKYVLCNPVKAGLVDDWTKWPWSFCRFGTEL